MSGETFCLLGLDSLGTKDSLSPIGDNVVCLENNSSGMADNRGLFGPAICRSSGIFHVPLTIIWCFGLKWLLFHEMARKHLAKRLLVH